MYSAIFLILALIIILSLTSKNRKYKRTEYAKITGLKLKDVEGDVGRYGEYLTYCQLNRIKGYKRFLFNLLVPAKDGKTTEIDVLMIHSSGIYVFECKNYKGWIFGNEDQRFWTQTLSVGKGKKAKKETFYNPMMQNRSHILWLKKYLSSSFPVHSYIVFGNGCSFKSVTQTSGMHVLSHISDVAPCVEADATVAGSIYSNEYIDAVYKKLYPLTCNSDIMMKKHVEYVKTVQNTDRANAVRNTSQGHKPIASNIAVDKTHDNESVVIILPNSAPWAAYSKSVQKKKPVESSSSTATGIPPWRKADA